MARRKSRSKPAPKKRLLEKLDKVFSCPFCNHMYGVECVIDMKLRIGSAVCCICDAHYSTKINRLTEPIDIYSEWIDECERVNNAEEEEVF
ncbi:hypothetical protein MKW98_012818 [Papaver atlanticum]|uniref:Transcription elongation factor 1 homolog n=1 Tax=Papaver atlanticum TaxID=357466 RepID=A0AAD4SNS6_9MAGN|nr:hypothetical protein MKW98_012818 [Papaver atlanticum]